MTLFIKQYWNTDIMLGSQDKSWTPILFLSLQKAFVICAVVQMKAGTN